MLAENTEGAKTQEVKSGSPWSESIFAPDTSALHQIQEDTRQSPSFVGFVPLIDAAYIQKGVLNKDFSDIVPLELFRYYCIGLLWIRLLQIRPRSHEYDMFEREILQITSNVEYAVPVQVKLYIQAIGEITTLSGELIYPEYPHIPRDVIGHIHGLFPPLEADFAVHNLYEEIP